MTTSVESIYKRLSEIMNEAAGILKAMGFTRLGHEKHDSCPFCHLNLEEYVQSIPSDKYVTVDVPSDVLVAEYIIGRDKLVELINEVNKTGKVKFKVPKGEDDD